MKRQRIFICIPLLVCTMVALAYSWLQPEASVLADDEAPRAGEDIAELYRRVSPSVVSIEVEIDLFDVAGGTGFVVDKNGHIVTNAHVVEDALNILVVFHDGAKASAVLIGMDTFVDVAVLKVNVRPLRLKPVTYGNSEDLAVGQSVLAIGNPFGLEATLTTGIISGLKREIEFNDGSILEGMIQTDAAIAPGSSGGPLLNLDGEVIGVNSAGFGGRFGGTNFGFAIPSNTVKQISEKMIARVTRPATSTPTAKPLPTNTATETQQPTPTRILPFTETSTSTPTSTQTQPPSLPQRAEEVVPTATSQPIAIVQRRFEPTLTALPTMDETAVAELLATPPPRPTQQATWTAVPILAPTDVLLRPATATTPITTPTPDIGFVFNPTPSDETPQAEVGVRERLPTSTPTHFQPTVAVRPELLQPTIAAVSLVTTFSTSGASVYQYNVGLGQIFTFQNIQLAGGVRLFLPNPVDANSWVRTDYRGQLFYKPIGLPQEGAMSYLPFFHGFSVSSIEQNKNRVVELDWSADGQQFSFRIDPPPGTDTSNAGVWFWQPRNETQHDPTYPLIRDCPASGFKSCDLVYPSNARLWKTKGVQWSPIRGSNTVLLTVQLPEEGRNALAIAQAVRNLHYAANAPHFVRYDYGHWNLDGRGITVSGRRPDGRVIIGEVNNDLSGERVILDASARGLWLRDAVRRPNGQVVALGRPGAPGSGPVALYDSSGRQISGFIGEAAPEDVRWYRDRNLVVVSVQGRQFTVQVEGGATIDSTGLTNNPQFSASGFGSSTIPSGVIEGSEFYPGQQLRMLQDLNIRQDPSSNSPIVGGLETGDYVAILAGPHRDNRFEWWQVQTASDIVGWMAAKIDGYPTVGNF